MTYDIVARLRVLNHHAKKLAENESLHDLHRDALTRCENLTWQAAAKIDLLRAEIDLLRAERDELQKWKDAHNTFWRERAERRDAMREGEKKR